MPGMKGMKVIVASRTLRPQDYPKVQVVGENLEEVVRELREQDGKDIWLWGGGSLFRSLLDAKLVDAVEVAVVPVMLGDGIPLLPPGGRAKLKLTGHRLYKTSGTMMLNYDVEYGKGRPATAPRKAG